MHSVALRADVCLHWCHHRCQTCPQAFCEDCLPDGEIDAIGDVLPEFAVLGYMAKSNAYYIRCHDCHEHFRENPSDWQAWQKEMRETEAKLEAMSANDI
ncbi:hypothetical protein HWV62_40302 [Athelia sp. TMB]|nr:hypothetical protein HWV62_40302 [Athelia sp. TMB]